MAAGAFAVGDFAVGVNTVLGSADEVLADEVPTVEVEALWESSARIGADTGVKVLKSDEAQITLMYQSTATKGVEMEIVVTVSSITAVGVETSVWQPPSPWKTIPLFTSQSLPAPLTGLEDRRYSAYIGQQ